jgi:hypothetical protein
MPIIPRKPQANVVIPGSGIYVRLDQVKCIRPPGPMRKDAHALAREKICEQCVGPDGWYNADQKICMHPDYACPRNKRARRIPWRMAGRCPIKKH